ncbi:MAG TPA: glutamate--tRNA ligase [Gammaproteobacteria bacterium]|jgi:glutamyl-tRNA synthetase|nr:glutamate--tRNA ligase [Gammaproteobacteria bacterium]
MTVRTRFAPSPTGYLHIGGARTALFCWLYSRHHGGDFILRIEDTDRERSTEAAVQAILDGMAWLELAPDEGPFYQTQRFDRYREVAGKLLAEGHAFHCYCSKQELEAMRAEQMVRKEKPRYDGRCRRRKEPVPGVAPVIRFKNPEMGQTVVEDAVKGRVVFDNHELDDLIIVRSDGTPTYNFCVVVDDMDMRITHVIRGDDHLNNAPRQMNILKALGVTPPRYAHLPMILGPDGTKLSKRHGAVSVMQYREDGFLPEAVINYLVRLGWSHGDQEIFSREEMVKLFDIEDVNKSASAINPQKLLWINQHYIKNGDVPALAAELKWHLDRLGVDTAGGPSLEGLVKAQQERAKTLKEMAEGSRFFFEEVKEYEPQAAAKNLTADALPGLEALRAKFAALPDWSAAALHDVLNTTAESLGTKLGKLAQPVRVAVSGGGVSPPIDATLELLGRERSLARLDQAIGFIRKAG